MLEHNELQFKMSLNLNESLKKLDSGLMIPKLSSLLSVFESLPLNMKLQEASVVVIYINKTKWIYSSTFTFKDRKWRWGRAAQAPETSEAENSDLQIFLFSIEHRNVM